MTIPITAIQATFISPVTNITAISAQRVRMRAEMFRGAMTDAEIEAFIEAEKAKLN